MAVKSGFLNCGRFLRPFFVKKNFLIFLMAVSIFAAGCKSVSRMINKGGVAFVAEIQTDALNQNEIVERAVKITQHRLDAIGADGEVEKISGKDNQISVKIYGSLSADKIEALKKLLFTTYQLELKKAVSPLSPAPLQTFPTREAAAAAATNEQEVLPYAETSESRQAFIIVEKQPIISGEDVRDAQIVSRSGSRDDYTIAFSLRPEGATRFGDWTSKNIGSYLAIVLDKKVQSAPFIRSQITDSGEISGRFTKQTAENIAIALKSGYLPAQIKAIEEKPFGN